MVKGLESPVRSLLVQPLIGLWHGRRVCAQSKENVYPRTLVSTGPLLAWKPLKDGSAQVTPAHRSVVST